MGGARIGGAQARAAQVARVGGGVGEAWRLARGGRVPGLGDACTLFPRRPPTRRSGCCGLPTSPTRLGARWVVCPQNEPRPRREHAARLGGAEPATRGPPPLAVRRDLLELAKQEPISHRNLPKSDETSAKLEQAGLEVLEYDRHFGFDCVRHSPEDIDKHKDLIVGLLKQALDGHLDTEPKPRAHAAG